MNAIYTCLIILFGLAYAILIFSFFVGWVRQSLVSTPSSRATQAEIPFVSVVVAARNEAARIGSLLAAMERQTWPAGRFELIVVDDHSADETGRHVSDYIKEREGNEPADALTKLQVIHASASGIPQGKKHALALGIGHARGDIILTTDADCRPAPHWVERLSGAFADPAVQMVLGPVRLKGKGLFGQLQELEFLSLMGVTGGAAGIGHPVMCNGASLGFRKAAWLQAGGYSGSEAFASGDDVFLMHAVKRHHAKIPVRFLKDREAVVETEAVGGLPAFFRQRGRWAGKASGYKDPFTLLTGGVVAGFNLLLVFALALWFTESLLSAGSENAVWQIPAVLLPGTAGQWIFIAFMAKALADFLLLAAAARFFNMSNRLAWFPLLFPLYPIYVMISIIVGWVRKNKW